MNGHAARIVLCIQAAGRFVCFEIFFSDLNWTSWQGANQTPFIWDNNKQKKKKQLKSILTFESAGLRLFAPRHVQHLIALCATILSQIELKSFTFARAARSARSYPLDKKRVITQRTRTHAHIHSLDGLFSTCETATKIRDRAHTHQWNGNHVNQTRCRLQSNGRRTRNGDDQHTTKMLCGLALPPWRTPMPGFGSP